MNHIDALQAAAGELPFCTAKKVIYIFLSGGLSQHDSFDPKPLAPAEIRGEFEPIATATPGVQICEHLPMLAARSQHWALVRSLTHPYSEHSQGHAVMLSGQTKLARGFSPAAPQPGDHPSMAAVLGSVTQMQNNLPPAIVLPEKLIHRTGRVIPGQAAGTMGQHRDPYFLSACRFNASSYGAWPEYGFDHQRGEDNPAGFEFQAPNLTLPMELSKRRLGERVGLLELVERQQRYLESEANVAQFDRFRARAISLLADGKMASVFDVHNADDKTQDRYGRNTFGWSLLLARRLIEAGVNLVQVNLGNNETWDTHGNAFPNLRDRLLPPMDRSVSALIDDLHDRGMLDDTLIVMAGEFGRTPRVSLLSKFYTTAGRDHWGAVQTVFFAGGGVKGGNVIGASDKMGGRPAFDAQRPENMAASIYQSLGLPRNTAWYDMLERPMPIYHAEPIRGLM
jgi:hypothetical protein